MAELLVVSTNPQAASTLARFFEGEGYSATAVTNGEEAAERLASEDLPDLVIATYDGGKDLVETLHLAARAGSVPFLPIATGGFRDHAIETYSRGAAGYVLEPLNTVELKTSVARALDRTAEAARRFTFDVLSTLAEGVVILSHQNSILFANTRAEQLFGRELASLRGQSVVELGNAELEGMLEDAIGGERKSMTRNLVVGVDSVICTTRVHVLFDHKERSVGFALSFMSGSAGDEEGARRAREAEELREALTYSLVADPALADGDEARSWSLQRFELASKAVSELSRPLVYEPIGLLIPEIVEIAAVKVRKQAREGRVLDSGEPVNGGRMEARRELLDTAVRLLLMASLQATPAGGRVELRLVAGDGELRLTIRDGGPTFAEPESALAKDSEDPRNGGLALHLGARLIAHHRGRVEVHAGEPGLTIHLGKTLDFQAN